MIRSYRYLLRPTSRQADALRATLAIHAEVYNAALEHRRDAWRKARASITVAQQCRELTEVRALRPDVAAINAQSLQQTLRRLDIAFQAFFRRVKAGQAPGFPRFRSTARFDSIAFPQPPADGGLRGGRLNVSGIGSVRIHQHRPIPDGARIKQVRVVRQGRRWYAVLTCDHVPARSFPRPNGGAVGIDMGVASLVTTSDGRQHGNPRHLAASATRIARTQQEVSRCIRGSNRRRQAVERLSALHRVVNRQRLDTAHKVALSLVREHDVIAHEQLNIANMVRRPKPKPDGTGGFLPNRAASKAGLNRSILDAGWGVLLRVLAEKAEEAARTIIAVDPRHTSQRCHECGHVAAGNRVSQAEFRCQQCGHQAHADVNAARNVLYRAGLVLREASPAPNEKPSPKGQGGVTSTAAVAPPLTADTCRRDITH